MVAKLTYNQDGQLQTQNPNQAGPVLALIRQTVQERVRLAELGLNDPNTFRLRLRQGTGEPAATDAPTGSREATR